EFRAADVRLLETERSQQLRSAVTARHLDLCECAGYPGGNRHRLRLLYPGIPSRQKAHPGPRLGATDSGRSREREMHRYFDANDEAYQAFNFMDSDAQKIQDMSVEIRVDEHIKAIQALLDILAMQIGFSAGAFTFDGQGVKTATEVVSENSKTYRTKNSHEVVVEEALKELIACIVQAAELYGLF